MIGLSTMAKAYHFSMKSAIFKCELFIFKSESNRFTFEKVGKKCTKNVLNAPK
jgi:hypothetical protein